MAALALTAPALAAQRSRPAPAPTGPPPGEWPAPGRDAGLTRYSPLDQITTENVAALRPVWTFSTGVLRGHEGSPLVIDGVMYLHSPFPNKVYALNLDNQQILWKYEPKQDPAVIPQMCCDTVNRGVAYAEGKVILQQADSTLVALDAKTGKVVWSVKNGDPKLGAVNTNAPHVFKDKVFTGISGGEWGVRGFIAAYNLSDGKERWSYSGTSRVANSTPAVTPIARPWPTRPSEVTR